MILQQVSPLKMKSNQQLDSTDVLASSPRKHAMRVRGQGRRERRAHLVQEKEEIREYLAKLRQIVPACPKEGKLSRLDLIQYVIDYIVQLQDTLVHHPVNKIIGDAISLEEVVTKQELAGLCSRHSECSKSSSKTSGRRPLGVLSSTKAHPYL